MFYPMAIILPKDKGINEIFLGDSVERAEYLGFVMPTGKRGEGIYVTGVKFREKYNFPVKTAPAPSGFVNLGKNLRPFLKTIGIEVEGVYFLSTAGSVEKFER